MKYIGLKRKMKFEYKLKEEKEEKKKNQVGGGVRDGNRMGKEGGMRKVHVEEEGT